MCIFCKSNCHCKSCDCRTLESNLQPVREFEATQLGLWFQVFCGSGEITQTPQKDRISFIQSRGQPRLGGRTQRHTFWYREANSLGHVQVLGDHGRWKWPLEGVQEVGDCELQDDICRVHARTNPASRSERKEFEVLPVAVDVRVASLHEPLGIECQRIVPRFWVPPDRVRVHQQPAFCGDVIPKGPGSIHRFMGEEERRRRVEAQGLFADALDVLEVWEVGFLHQFVVADYFVKLRLRFPQHNAWVAENLWHRPLDGHYRRVCCGHEGVLQKN